MTTSHLTLAVDNARCAHPGWKEEYYGWRCVACPCFVPFGCEPWCDDALDVASALGAVAREMGRERDDD